MFLVILFAVGASSMMIHPMNETSQINESELDSVPVITAIIDYMKDMLDEINVIQEETLKQGCQKSKLVMQEEDPGHDMERASAQAPQPNMVPQKTSMPTHAECSSLCPAMYDPVCGSDGITYSNDCNLSVARCNNPGDDIVGLYKGQCEPAPTTSPTDTSFSSCIFLTERSGIFRYPSDGSNYQNNEDVCLIIFTRPGSVIEIEFLSFDVESGHDNVYIRDGPDRNTRLLGQYSGQTVPAKIRTTGNAAFGRFVSDPTVTHKGFTFYWNTIDFADAPPPPPHTRKE